MTLKGYLKSVPSGAILSIDMKQQKKEVLTDREWEVAQAVSNGMSSKEVAEQFGLSIHTVRNHRKKIMKKLGVKKSATWLLHLQQNVGKPVQKREV
jgi:DNA-binding CsgD family transcriptional regulator